MRVVSATVGRAHALDATYKFHIKNRTTPRLVGQAIGQHAVDIVFDETVQFTDASDFSLVPLNFAEVP